MESRIIALEEFAVETRDRLARIDTRLDAFATKADLMDLKADLHMQLKKLHKEMNSMTWKLFGASLMMVAAVYWIARNIH